MPPHTPPSILFFPERYSLLDFFMIIILIQVVFIDFSIFFQSAIAQRNS